MSYRYPTIPYASLCSLAVHIVQHAQTISRVPICYILAKLLPRNIAYLRLNSDDVNRRVSRIE
jgi:hypothetical protein